MQFHTWLSIVSAALGLMGSVVLAFSLDRALGTLRTHTEALDVTLNALVGQGNVPVFVGFDRHHERSFSASSRRVKVGCTLLVLAFLSQLVGTLVPSPAPPTFPVTATS